MTARPLASVVGSLLLAATLGTGCGQAGEATVPPPRPVEERAPQDEPAGPVAEATTTVFRSIRDDDVIDRATLAATIAAGADGDREWIDTFAELRADGWLLNRYPGRYDPLAIYAEDWAVDTALVNEAERLELDVYLDEPLPRLVSVIRTRSIGSLTELDVVLDAGEAVVRREQDDSEYTRLPGGRARGLFTIAEDGPEGRWRIHSVVELAPLDEAEESNP